MSYVSLHTHTDASSDGAGTVESLVKRASEIGMSALAMTDHATLANAVAFWGACQDHEVMPIFGMEAYLLYKGTRHHMTILSLSERGFNELIGVSTNAYINRYVEGYPLIELSDFTGNEDLFILTGCASSAIHAGLDEHGLMYVYDLIDTFGRFRVGLELMFVGSQNVWDRVKKIQLHEPYLPLVLTNDTHYPCREQFPAHQAITKARKGYTYDSQHLWLKTADEILFEGKKYFDLSTLELALENTNQIAKAVVPWSMKAEPKLPVIPDVEEKLRAKLIEAIKEDVARKGQKRVRAERLQYEFHVLKEKGFLDYIYILWDIVAWAKGNNVMVGPGRGSGGGSYLLYLLGVTTIDPIEWGLLFERFINAARGDYPDVDVDFESDKRQLVMEYAKTKWGTVPIATYSCYAHKSAIHDIARVLTIPKSFEETAADSTVESEAFEKFINQAPDALVTYQTMMGQIRHRGKHAAGVIITDKPIPIERAGKDGELVAAWAEGTNTKDLSKVGIVKFDLLGLTALSQLHWLKEVTGEEPEGWDDPEVYELFCKGDVSGVFQWTGSDGIRQLTIRIGPRNFKDLATINALYRPGALNAGTAEDYPTYMGSPRLLEPRIDKILQETYGVICFQEQVQQLIALITGGDLYAGDTGRRLLTKANVTNPKWIKQIEELRNEFITKGLAGGFDDSVLGLVWHEIFQHAQYSFNKSHAFAYTMTSYRLAWYKVYHRAAFTVAMLQYDSANAQTYIIDAVEAGLKVRMPNVNSSGAGYTLKRGEVFLPLSNIKHLGEKGVDAILKAREEKGAFLDYQSFNEAVAKKACNSRARVQLQRIGAFIDLAGDPKDAIEKYEDIPVESRYQAQLEVLGYIVPSQQLLRKINKLREQPAKKEHENFAGFVKEIDNKKSAKGPYTVYHLSPFGHFWIRNGEGRYQVGDFVAGSKSKFGNSSDVKRYKLGES